MVLVGVCQSGSIKSFGKKMGKGWQRVGCGLEI